jgi:hypothetical protein
VRRSPTRPRLTVAATLLAAGALAGCGSATGLNTGGTPAAGGGSTGMAGMSPGQSQTGAGQPATHVLATADWQEMKIEAGTAAPTTFYVPSGIGDQTVVHRPPKHASFQLTVDLTDQRSGVPLPYATVRAKITDAAGAVVYDAEQWPMLSPTAGSYYGDNVALPRPGRYTLALTVTPPVGARHIEYAHVWTRPHVVVEHFTWPAPT